MGLVREVGQAEDAVGLPDGTPTWERFPVWSHDNFTDRQLLLRQKSTGVESFKWLIPVGAAALTGAIVMYFAGASALAISFALSATVAIILATLFSILASKRPISSRFWVDLVGVASSPCRNSCFRSHSDLRQSQNWYSRKLLVPGVGALAFAWPVPGAVAATVAIAVSSVVAEAALEGARSSLSVLFAA